MKFKFIGGNLCLDFINTVGDHLNAKGSEYLRNYEDLLAWGVAAGIFSEAEKEQFAARVDPKSAEAAQILKKAVRLREILFKMLRALISKKAPAPTLTEEFNGYLNEALKHLRVEQTGEHFSFNWKNSKDDPEQIAWIITWSAANLLVDENLRLLKMCGDQSCGWLFLDTSKNKRRAWCDMKDCGNRYKLRRYYSKSRSSE